MPPKTIISSLLSITINRSGGMDRGGYSEERGDEAFLQ